MAFGSEYGNIMGKEDCPACNAKADLRSRVEAKHRVVVRMVCPKCHRVLFRGITTVEAVAFQRVRRNLDEALANATRPEHRARIRRKIEELDRRESLATLFLN